MKFLENIFTLSSNYQNILKEIFVNKNTVGISGLSNIHKTHFVHSATRKQNQPALIIVPSENIAQNLIKDLSAMGSQAALYPARELNFYNIDSHLPR